RCTSNWQGHSEYACMGLFTNEWDESFRPDFIVILLPLLLVLFISKLLATFTIIFYFLFILCKVLLFIALLCGNFIAIYYSIIYRNRNKAFSIFLITILVITEVVLYLLGIHPLNTKVYFILQTLGILITLIRAIFKR